MDRYSPVAITDLTESNSAAQEEIALLLMDAFPQAWPTRDEAMKEIRESFEADRMSRIAIGARGEALGWIGAISQYDGHTWEIHPLVVHPDYRTQGIGRALVADIERLAADRGAITLYLGTDDETDATSLSGVDLYDDLWGHIARMRNLREHPYSFYERIGFTVVGVIPDANGPGKPDIFMAKRVRSERGDVTG